MADMTDPVAPARRHGLPVASTLLAALGELADVSDALTGAVERRELTTLVALVGRAEGLVAQVHASIGDLTPSARSDLPAERLAGLADRLGTAARRNALLIERAWALEAATLRIIAGLGRGFDRGVTAIYPAPPPLPPYVDRQA